MGYMVYEQTGTPRPTNHFPDAPPTEHLGDIDILFLASVANCGFL